MTNSKIKGENLFAIVFISAIVMFTMLGCQPSPESKSTPMVIEESNTVQPDLPVSVSESPVSIFDSTIALPYLGSDSFERFIANLSPDDQGTVAGQLVDVAGIYPLIDVGVYLGKIEGSGEFPVVALDRETAPSVMTDAEGIFYFTDVEEGKYVIIIGAEGVGGMIENNETKTTLVLDVKNGQITNVGQIATQTP